MQTASTQPFELAASIIEWLQLFAFVREDIFAEFIECEMAAPWAFFPLGKGIVNVRYKEIGRNYLNILHNRNVSDIKACGNVVDFHADTVDGLSMECIMAFNREEEHMLAWQVPELFDAFP